MIDDTIIDLIEDDSDMFSEDSKEEHQSSDESIGDDNFMSEDNDEDYDSNKVNDIETD